MTLQESRPTCCLPVRGLEMAIQFAKRRVVKGAGTNLYALFVRDFMSEGRPIEAPNNVIKPIPNPPAFR